MKKTILALVAITAPLLLGASKPIYLDSSKPMDLRVDDALSRMNLSEILFAGRSAPRDPRIMDNRRAPWYTS